MDGQGDGQHLEDGRSPAETVGQGRNRELMPGLELTIDPGQNRVMHGSNPYTVLAAMSIATQSAREVARTDFRWRGGLSKRYRWRSAA